MVDYRAMQNSQAAMDLKGRVLPPELKQLEQALKQSGLNENHDVDGLAFAAFRAGSGPDSTRIVGIAQGNFQLDEIVANFKKKKVKPLLLRANKIYPMGNSGMLVTFLDPSTLVFGTKEAIKSALDARDGMAESMLYNTAMLDMMQGVDNEPLWTFSIRRARRS